MQTLEKILNKLITLGWKPWGLEMLDRGITIGKDNKICSWAKEWAYNYSLNDLCSIESGLWQFVVEKGLYKDNHDTFVWNYLDKDDNDDNTCYQIFDTNYRLMLSSIQSEKTKFLLDNIIIKDADTMRNDG